MTVLLLLTLLVGGVVGGALRMMYLAQCLACLTLPFVCLAWLVTPLSLASRPSLVDSPSVTSVVCLALCAGRRHRRLLRYLFETRALDQRSSSLSTSSDFLLWQVNSSRGIGRQLRDIIYCESVEVGGILNQIDADFVNIGSRVALVLSFVWRRLSAPRS